MVLSRLFEATFNHWLANHWLTSIKEWLTSISDVMMVMSSHNASGGMTFSGLPRLFFLFKMPTPKRERSDNFTVKEMSVIIEAFKPVFYSPVPWSGQTWQTSSFHCQASPFVQQQLAWLLSDRRGCSHLFCAKRLKHWPFRWSGTKREITRYSFLVAKRKDC